MFKRVSVLAIVLILPALIVAACGGDDETTTTEESVNTPVADTPADTPAASGATQVSVVNQDPGGTGEYKFSPNGFKFTVGEKVEFIITAETEFHTFTVDELDIDVTLSGGITETLAFTFDKAGEYKLFCIPHEALGMVATITVE